jgi:hypothetical protein
MTFAEAILLIAGVVGTYLLLRPLQRWLEALFLRKLLSTRHPRLRRTMIDVTHFKSQASHKEEDHEHDS